MPENNQESRVNDLGQCIGIATDMLRPNIQSTDADSLLAECRVNDLNQRVATHDYRTNGEVVTHTTDNSRGVDLIASLENLRQTVEGFKTYKYICRTPRVALETEEQLRNSPVFITGIEAVDRAAPGELVERWLSIEHMLVVRRRGFGIAVCDPSDCEDIYRNVERYMTLHTQTIENAIAIPQSLLQDLYDLDKLASDLYPYLNKELLNPLRNVIDSRLMQVMNLGNIRRADEYQSIGSFLDRVQNRGY